MTLSTLLVAVVATVATFSVPPAGSSVAHSSQITVAIYGDSMQWEAEPWIAAALHRMSDPPRIIVHAVPGLAICDFLGQMKSDAATYHPQAVLILFIGNWFTKCMAASWAKGFAAVDAQYEANTKTAATIFVKGGARHIFVMSSPAEPPNPFPTIGSSVTFEQYASGVRKAEKRAVKSFDVHDGVVWINAGQSVDQLTTNAFTYSRECVLYEVNHHLCLGVPGSKLSNPVRIKDGHFCALATARTKYCPGAFRYGNAEATALMDVYGWTPPPITDYEGVQ